MSETEKSSREINELTVSNDELVVVTESDKTYQQTRRPKRKLMAVTGLATYPESSPTAFTTRRTAAENSKNRMTMKRGLLRTREENEGEGKR